MSTGDQSEYLRKKMAERRSHYEQGGQFMKSGFSLWAENERPARHGGAKKEPEERVSTKAGKDILDRVRSLGEDMFAQYYKGSAKHIQGKHEESESDEEEAGCGGAALMGVMEEGKGYSGNARPAPGCVERRMAQDESRAQAEAKCGMGRISDLKTRHLAPAGKGKLEVIHHEDGHGMEIKEGKGKKKRGKQSAKDFLKTMVGVGGATIPEAKAHGIKPSMKTYVKETVGRGGYMKQAKDYTSGYPKEFQPAYDELFRRADYAGEKVKTGLLTSADRCDPGEEGELKLNLANKLLTIWDDETNKFRRPDLINSLIDQTIQEGVGGKPCPTKAVAKKYTGPMFVKSTGKGKKHYDEGTAIRESEANSEEEASGRVESTGSGKRSARAAIVKKVMKEKGLSLIEASKYVKAHGLYKA